MCIRNKFAALRFLCRQQEVKNWLEEIFKDEYIFDNNIDFIEHIKDGVIFSFY